jgi:hypothetical protein
VPTINDTVGVVSIELGNGSESGCQVCQVFLALKDPDGGAIVGRIFAIVKKISSVHL